MPFQKPEDRNPEAHELALRLAVAFREGNGGGLCCNFCGRLGADWIDGARPGWGSLALCPPHRTEYEQEMARHLQAMRRLRTIHFEQPTNRDDAFRMSGSTTWRKRHDGEIERLVEVSRGSDNSQIIEVRRVDAEWERNASYAATYRRKESDPLSYEGTGRTANAALINLRLKLVRAEVMAGEAVSRLEVKHVERTRPRVGIPASL